MMPTTEQHLADLAELAEHIGILQPRRRSRRSGQRGGVTKAVRHAGHPIGVAAVDGRARTAFLGAGDIGRIAPAPPSHLGQRIGHRRRRRCSSPSSSADHAARVPNRCLFLHRRRPYIPLHPLRVPRLQTASQNNFIWHTSGSTSGTRWLMTIRAGATCRCRRSAISTSIRDGQGPGPFLRMVARDGSRTWGSSPPKVGAGGWTGSPLGRAITPSCRASRSGSVRNCLRWVAGSRTLVDKFLASQ